MAMNIGPVVPVPLNSILPELDGPVVPPPPGIGPVVPPVN